LISQGFDVETQNIVNLLEARLLSQHKNLVLLLGIKEHKKTRVPYTSIKFRFQCNNYEIKVFNSKFMILKESETTGTVYDNLKKMHKALDEIITSTQYFEY